MNESKTTAPASIAQPAPVDGSQAEINRLRLESEKFYQALVIDMPVNKMPERIFHDVFFPYFSGQKSMVENPDIIKTWVSIAGSPRSPVDITENNSDTVLFRIPPLFDTSFIQPNSNIPYAGIIKEYNERVSSTPKMGENFLKKVLGDVKTVLFTDNNRVEEYREMWNKMFAYYHLGENTETKPEGAIGDDELIMD